MNSAFRAAPASLALCLAASLALGGCSSATKQALGLEKTAPDEFNIVARAPLSLPPDYSLRPPEPGALRPQDQTPTQQARQTVFRAGEQQAALPTPRGGQTAGEMALLKQAGATDANPSVRQLVNQETRAQVEQDRSFVDSVLFWRKPDLPGTVVDPQKENQRLRENAALGKAPTAGETAIIQRKNRALLEGIF